MSAHVLEVISESWSSLGLSFFSSSDKALIIFFKILMKCFYFCWNVCVMLYVSIEHNICFAFYCKRFINISFRRIIVHVVILTSSWDASSVVYNICRSFFSRSLDRVNRSLLSSRDNWDVEHHILRCIGLPFWVEVYGWFESVQGIRMVWKSNAEGPARGRGGIYKCKWMWDANVTQRRCRLEIAIETDLSWRKELDESLRD